MTKQDIDKLQELFDGMYEIADRCGEELTTLVSASGHETPKSVTGTIANMAAALLGAATYNNNFADALMLAAGEYRRLARPKSFPVKPSNRHKS